MSYDPTRDPRWLPGTSEVTVDEDRRLKLELALSVEGELLDMFETPGWEHFMRMVGRDHGAADMALKRELDHAAWMLIRGQNEIYLWLMDLPEQIRREQAQTWAKLRELTGEE